MQSSGNSLKTIRICCQGAATQELDQLKELQGGLKKLSKKNLEKLKRRIISEGFCAPFFIWDDGSQLRIIDGHQRRAALVSLRADGWDVPALPVDYIHAETEEQAQRILLSVSSQYGEWVTEELQDWLDRFDDDLRETLRVVDKEMTLPVITEKTEGDDELPEEVEPITKLGDLWELGSHRLLCGDSTEINNIMMLIENEKIDFVFTDPPYGIEIVKNKSIGGSKPFGKEKNKIIECGLYEPIKGDNTIDSAIACYDISKALKIKTVLLWGGNFYAHKLPPAKCFVVWDKETDGKFGDGEIAWCSANKSIRIFRHEWSGMLKASEQRDKRQHPTQKPVALAEWAIKEFMKEDEKNILDFFGGAGFTLLAAEKTGKKSFICELSEHYCDVIVNRYKEWCIKNGHECVIKLNGDAI